MSTRLASPELANCALWVRPLWASHLPKLSDNPRYYDALCIFAVCGVNKGPSMPARPSYPKAWNWGEKVPLYLIRVIQQIFQDLSDCACVHNLCWYLQASFCICWGSLHGESWGYKLLTDKHTLVTRSHFSLFLFSSHQGCVKETLRLYDSPARFELSQPGAFRSQSLPPSKTSFSVIFQILSDNFNWTNTWKTDEAWLELYRTYVCVKQKDLQQSTEVCRFGGIKYVVSTQPVHCHEGLGQAKAAHEWRQANTYRQLPRLPSFFS